MSKRILCILGSKHFYGKERSNIEVYNLLKNQEEYVLKVILNKDGSKQLKSYLSNFQIIAVKFPDRSQEKLKYLKYVWASLRLNLKMIYTLLKFRPHYMFLNDERVFYDMAIPIYLSRAKVIYRIGDRPAFPKLKNYKVNSWIWRNIILRKTQSFVYISNFIRKTVEATGRNSEEDFVIYNYPPRRKKTNEDSKNKYLPTAGVSIGYIGQLIEEKGVSLFVEAAIRLLKEKKNLIFYLAGDLNYSKKFSEKLIKSVADNKLENRIIFLNSIDDVKTFFEKVDILVTPSLKEEPLGNVIVEAKKYATPSIIFKSGGMPELIAHETDGFICENRTATDIVKGIDYYLTNPQLIAIHGANAKASVKELKIDYENFKKKWLRVFGGSNQCSSKI